MRSIVDPIPDHPHNAAGGAQPATRLALSEGTTVNIVNGNPHLPSDRFRCGRLSPVITG